MNTDTELGIMLHAVQHFEPAPAAGALDIVGRISDLLQLQQDKPGYHDHAIDNVGFNQIGDATVDDHAGIEEEEAIGLVLG